MVYIYYGNMLVHRVVLSNLSFDICFANKLRVCE